MPPKTQSKKTKGKRRRAKTPKKVVSRGVTVNVNIGSTSKRRARNYITPNRTQQNNLIPATLIGQRSEPYDLGILGKLQERINKIDNLSRGVYDRDFILEEQRVEQQNQEDEGVARVLQEQTDEKSAAKQSKVIPEAESRPKPGRPPAKIAKGTPLTPLAESFVVQGIPAQGEVLLPTDLDAHLTGEFGNLPSPVSEKKGRSKKAPQTKEEKAAEKKAKKAAEDREQLGIAALGTPDIRTFGFKDPMAKKRSSSLSI
jgi:hypothetical protein